MERGPAFGKTEAGAGGGDWPMFLHGPARGATVPDGRPDAPGPMVHVALDADVDAVLEEIARRLRD